jgi:hypothetical protein
MLAPHVGKVPKIVIVPTWLAHFAPDPSQDACRQWNVLKKLSQSAVTTGIHGFHAILGREPTLVTNSARNVPIVWHSRGAGAPHNLPTCA